MPPGGPIPVVIAGVARTAAGSYLGTMVQMPKKPFDDVEKLAELRGSLEMTDGLRIPEKRLEKWPSFPISVLGTEAALASFPSTIEWAFNEARSARPPDSLDQRPSAASRTRS